MTNQSQVLDNLVQTSVLSIVSPLGHASNQSPHVLLLFLPDSPQRHRQHHAQSQAAAQPYLDQPANGVFSISNDRSNRLFTRSTSVC